MSKPPIAASTYVVYDAIVAGSLLPVLDQWDLPRLTINLA